MAKRTNNAAPVVEEEKTTEVEQTVNATTENNSVVAEPTESNVETELAAVEETPADEVTEPVETPVETKPETEEKARNGSQNDKPAEEKLIADDAKVIIKCEAYAGKELVLPTRTITLDEKGCCEVTGIEAKRLLSLPGYELSK
jgi:hypothetical protein